MNYRFLDAARRELIDAGRYYAAKNRQLVEDLENEVDRALEYLCEFPKAAKRIDAIYRSYKLHRFPYLLIYRIEDAELVIVAVAHAAKKPDYWRGRDPGEE
ncbi:MAG: type II toxin-antitoxin system RelE/ParE family toxin [Rhodomicrobium sp.]|jgi:plasmid stabilization system protein ParE